MGEYAKFNGERVKIGTCEDMYYLRADQRHLIETERGNVDVFEDAAAIRFRFPFPDEDHIQPGTFEDYGRAIPVHGLTVPDEVEHHSIQYHNDRGFLVSLPCPESKEPQPAQIHRNGYAGAVRIVQQRFWNGLLVLVCECGGCGVKYRYETLEQAQPVIDACRAEAMETGPERWNKGSYGADHPRIDESRTKWWRTIADRIEAGYLRDYPGKPKTQEDCAHQMQNNGDHDICPLCGFTQDGLTPTPQRS